ncbi:MAG: helix-turn-helix domain-containing protein [Acidimicrobiales bacterium]
MGTRSPEDEEPKGSVFPGFDALAEDADALIADLVELRRRRGLSQTDIAKRMGTSQSALARVESGRSDLRLSTVARYAEALDVDLNFAIRTRPSDSGTKPTTPHPDGRR